jgi:DNA ligase (NAD+)
MEAGVDELVAVDEIGERIAGSVVEFFARESNRELVLRLQSVGVRMALDEQAVAEKSDTLKGLSIVISGVFEKHSRDEYKEIIERNGGKNVGSVSKSTSFILAGANMGPAKLEKAEKLGVRIVAEDEFLTMIAEG